MREWTGRTVTSPEGSGRLSRRPPRLRRRSGHLGRRRGRLSGGIGRLDRREGRGRMRREERMLQNLPSGLRFQRLTRRSPQFVGATCGRPPALARVGFRLSAPGWSFERALKVGTGVYRLAVRDDHELERQSQELARSRKHPLLMPGSRPHAQLASWRRQRIGED
jgi:hypothetical protein